MESNKVPKRHAVEDQTKAANETTEVVNNEEITNQGKVIEITPEEFIQREETSTNELPIVKAEKHSSVREKSSKQPKKFEFPEAEDVEDNNSKVKVRTQYFIEKGKRTINNFDREEALAKAKDTSSNLQV